MKKILTMLILFFFFSSKSFSQTTTNSDTTITNKVYVDVGFLLNDYQKPTQLKILKLSDHSSTLKSDPLLIRAVKMKLAELPQEIITGEWSDTTQSYIMHLIYDMIKKEVE